MTSKTVVIKFLTGFTESIVDVPGSKRLSSLAQEIHVRRGIAASSMVHLGYGRPINGIAGQDGEENLDSDDDEEQDEYEIVLFDLALTTVAQAFNMIIEVIKSLLKYHT